MCFSATVLAIKPRILRTVVAIHVCRSFANVTKATYCRSWCRRRTFLLGFLQSCRCRRHCCSFLSFSLRLDPCLFVCLGPGYSRFASPGLCCFSCSTSISLLLCSKSCCTLPLLFFLSLSLPLFFLRFLLQTNTFCLRRSRCCCSYG